MRRGRGLRPEAPRLAQRPGPARRSPGPRNTYTSQDVPSATLPPPKEATRDSLHSQARVSPSRDRMRLGSETGAAWPRDRTERAAPSRRQPRLSHRPAAWSPLTHPAEWPRRQGGGRAGPPAPGQTASPQAASASVTGGSAPARAAASAAAWPLPRRRARPGLLVFVFFPPATRPPAAPPIG